MLAWIHAAGAGKGLGAPHCIPGAAGWRMRSISRCRWARHKGQGLARNGALGPWLVLLPAVLPAQGDEAIENGCTPRPTDHPQPAAPINKPHSGQNQNSKFRSARNLSCQLWKLLVSSFTVACSQLCHPERGNITRGMALGTQAQVSQGLFPLGGSGG